jgi:hypothetical protein
MRCIDMTDKQNRVNQPYIIIITHLKPYSDPRQGPIVGVCEHSNEPSSYIRNKELFTIFWDITLFSPLKVNQRSEGTYCISLFVTCFHAGILLSLFFDPEDGGDMFLQNVG